MCEASNRWFENKVLEELVSFLIESCLKITLYWSHCTCFFLSMLNSRGDPSDRSHKNQSAAILSRWWLFHKFAYLTYHIFLATQHFRKYRIYNLNHEKNPTITFLNPKDLQNPARHWSLQMLIGLYGSSSSWVLPAFLSSSWLSARRSWLGPRGPEGWSLWQWWEVNILYSMFFLTCLERGGAE